MLPENMTSIKVSALYGSSAFSDAMIRTLVSDHGFKIGHRDGSKHPRYDVVDVVKVRLFEKLRNLHYAPKIAVSFVNRLSDDLVTITEKIAWELQDHKRAADDNSPWALLGYGPNPDDNEHIILPRLAGKIGNLDPDRSYVCIALGDVVSWSYFYVWGLIATGADTAAVGEYPDAGGGE